MVFKLLPPPHPLTPLEAILLLFILPPDRIRFLLIALWHRDTRNIWGWNLVGANQFFLARNRLLSPSLSGAWLWRGLYSRTGGTQGPASASNSRNDIDAAAAYKRLATAETGVSGVIASIIIVCRAACKSIWEFACGCWGCDGECDGLGIW